MKVKVIAFIGDIGAGKTTASNYIADIYDFKKESFARPLQTFSSFFFGIETVLGTQAQKNEIDPYWGVSYRQFAEFLGTDIFREEFPKRFPAMRIRNGIWTDIMCKNIQNEKLVVIDDMRFLNEAKGVRDISDCIIVKIQRTDGKMNEFQSSHVSNLEHCKINYDTAIENDGTDNFFQNIDDLMKSFGFIGKIKIYNTRKSDTFTTVIYTIENYGNEVKVYSYQNCSTFYWNEKENIYIDNSLCYFEDNSRLKRLRNKKNATSRQE